MTGTGNQGSHGQDNKGQQGGQSQSGDRSDEALRAGHKNDNDKARSAGGTNNDKSDRSQDR